MSFIAGIPVTEAVLEVVRLIVNSIPQNELLAYAATGAAFWGGGFQKRKPAVIRARIMQVVAGAEPVDSSLKLLIANHNDASDFLSLISVVAVKEFLPELEAIFGHDVVALALQLDPRLDDFAVVALATDTPAPTDAPPPTREEAVRTVREEFAVLLRAIGSGTPRPSGEEDAPVASGSLETIRALREARAELSRLKGASERLRKEQSLRDKAEAEAVKWREKAEALERETGPLRQRAEVAEAARDRCLRNAEAIADARLASRLAEEFAEWLGARRAALLAPFLVSGAGVPEPDPLLARAEAAFAKQAREDLVSGVRHVLQARLDAYREALRRCRALIADALRPTAELVAVERELDTEARRLAALLAPEAEPPATSPDEALARAINTAETRELPGLANILARLKSLGVLTNETASHLEEQIRNRYAEGYARRGGPGLDNGDAASPGQILDAAIAGAVPLVLLIDGHNALFALQSRYCRPQDHRGPSAEARDWLVDDIAQIVAGSHNCRVVIVFDGPEYSKKDVAGNVTVIYSGGGGSDVEHRADDVIVAEARHMRDSGAKVRILLATNDNGLASRVASLGVGNVPPTALLAYLR